MRPGIALMLSVSGGGVCRRTRSARGGVQDCEVFVRMSGN